MSTLTPLATAILRTITYYDVMDYPLTPAEVWRWLSPAPDAELNVSDVATVEAEITQLLTAGTLERRGAYVFLPGRSNLVETRTERFLRSQRLWRRAESTARFLELVPFIRMVAVVNTLAIDNVRPESDIDFLIVTAPGYIWMTRFLVTGIVSMLGYRRHGTKIAGRICLSFYLTTNALDLEPFRSESSDMHFAMWASQTTPLIDSGTYEKFVAANSWVTKLLPNAWPSEWQKKLLVPNAGLRSIRQFYELFFANPIGQYFVALARDRQLKKMDKNTHSKAGNGSTDVVISEDVLKFHEADRRKEYNSAWRKRLANLGITA